MKTLLKNAREQKGLKTREVAQILSIDQALISKFESGTRRPTKEQVSKLSQLLEIDYETIMVAWLKEKILYEIENEEFALKALLLAEQEIQNNRKEINSVILSSLQVSLDEIEILKNQIQSFNPFETRQISRALELDFIFKSIRFNGNSLTLEETKSIINEGLTIAGKSMQEQLEAINLQETISYIKALIQKKTPLNEKEFLAIHSLLFKGIKPENSGKYKNDAITTREINLLFNWHDTHKNTLHPLVLAAETHLKIASINPFEHGNLQMASLTLNWILLQHHYVYAGTDSNEKSITEYVSVLEHSQQTKDTSIFTNYILRIEKENLVRAIELISK